MNTEQYPNRKDPVLGTKVVTGLVVGRDKKVIPQSEVEHLASLGCRDSEIAEYFDISPSTLRYNFSSELTKGRHELKCRLRQAQLRVAFEGNPTMLIWLGRNILGQTETPLQAGREPLPFTDDDADDAKDDIDIDTMTSIDGTEHSTENNSTM